MFEIGDVVSVKSQDTTGVIMRLGARKAVVRCLGHSKPLYLKFEEMEKVGHVS